MPADCGEGLLWRVTRAMGRWTASDFFTGDASVIEWFVGIGVVLGSERLILGGFTCSLGITECAMRQI